MSLAGMFLVIGLLLAAGWQGPLKPISRWLSDQPIYAQSDGPIIAPKAVMAGEGAEAVDG